MWNIGSLREKEGKVYENLRKRMVDVCYLQEVQRRGKGPTRSGWREVNVSCGCQEIAIATVVLLLG